jgi:hypothetical protein
VSEPSLPEKIEALDGRLREEGIEHAFGGALALAYYAEPRATDDVDVNVFLAPQQFARLTSALAPLGIAATAEDERLAVNEGQCRLWWGRTPVDVFLAYDDLHEAMRADVRMVPFGETRIPILGPEHLLVCKAVFDRPKDWLDIEQMLLCVEELDTDEALRLVERTTGADDRRLRRLGRLVERDQPS